MSSSTASITAESVTSPLYPRALPSPISFAMPSEAAPSRSRRATRPLHEKPGGDGADARPPPVIRACWPVARGAVDIDGSPACLVARCLHRTSRPRLDETAVDVNDLTGDIGGIR